MKFTGSFVSFFIKECRHILREYRTLVMLFVIPLALVMLFGYVISTDIRNTPIAIFDRSQGDPLARRLVRQFEAGRQFEVVGQIHNKAQIEEAFRGGRVKMVVVIPERFESEVRCGVGGKTTEVQLIADASDLNVATTTLGYATAVIADLNARVGAEVGAITTDAAGAPLQVNVRMMYNPELRSAYMFVPGVIALIVMIMAAMMTSVTLAREREHGTLRLLTVSPLKARTIVLGKVLPYFALTVLNTTEIMLLGMLAFGMPCHGSLWAVGLLCGLFILAALGLGILISALVKRQQSALVGSLLGLMLPTMLLSGFIFPIANMPVVLQWASQVVPATWFIEAIKGIMLKGQSLADLWLPFTVLGGMSVVLVGAALGLFARRTRPRYR